MVLNRRFKAFKHKSIKKEKKDNREIIRRINIDRDKERNNDGRIGRDEKRVSFFFIYFFFLLIYIYNRDKEEIYIVIYKYIKKEKII